MSNTATPATLTDGRYWRRLLAVVHPDRNDGEGDLFLFLQGLREHVEECGEGPSLRSLSCYSVFQEAKKYGGGGLRGPRSLPTNKPGGAHPGAVAVDRIFVRGSRVWVPHTSRGLHTRAFL
jgi:hypothetical protein